jgi:TPR repeat protein
MTIYRSGAKVAAAIALLFVQPAGLAAQAVPLVFEPPEMEVSPVCVARASDEDLTAEWGAWDGSSLPDQDVGLINRDMRRLAEIDPVAWDATIQRVIILLPGVSRGFKADHVILARIDQLIALGQLQQLKSEGLVQQLLDQGDESSPKILNALAGFLTDGIGIDRDTARGEELLMASGYGGNADALLTLSRLSVAGSAPEGWNVNPQLAVTMAFGSLVGQIDPLICDRINRIAREFSSGEVVMTDHELAVRWYRFAADLGDPIAAWRVAEYQLQSELVTKDNDVLIHYLTKAADGKLPYAQVALGRIYEAGALVPTDIARARTLYEIAAGKDDRAGLIRLSGFLETQLHTDPSVKSAFLDSLDRLARIDNAPPWVFAKLATHILDNQGRWAGQNAAHDLLTRGAALDDPGSIMMLAKIDFGADRTEAAFYTTVDHLIHAVTTLGEAAPTADLQAAFMCKAPNAPLVEEALYWADAEASMGSSSFKFTGPDLRRLAENPDPLVMAALQTQALYGRATPLANLLAVLEHNGAPESEVAFWTVYAAQFSSVATARATLALDQASTKPARAAALDQFRAAVQANDRGAALKLAKALLIDNDKAARAEALALLLPLSAEGNGEAMSLLPVADRATYLSDRAVFEEFANVIDVRGDFVALMLAMPFLTDPADRETYRGRAISAMHCTFSEAVAFAAAMGAEGDLEEARRWLSIATQLVGNDGWQIVQLADSFRTLLGPNGEETALAYYEQAYSMGNRTAVLRLMRIFGNPKTDAYDQDRVVSLYTDLVSLSDPSEVSVILDDLSRKDESLRIAVEARLDVDQLYADAAAAGNPAAMREHARRLQIAAVTVDDLKESAKWLIQASEADDAPAMVMLAQAYSMGVGVPPSVEDARSWLIKAAEAGDATAIEMVKLFSVGQGTD